LGDTFKRITSQFTNFFSTLTVAKKIAMFVTAGVLMAGFAGLFMWAGDTTYTPLMTNLSPEDSANIIRFLRDKHVPFKVDPSGKNISIPPESVYELRLELATQGLPQTSIAGYELMDKQSPATPSFVQKLNQKRVQEGEIARAINIIHGVKRSKVHLALPQKSAFVEDQKKTTASVVLDLEAGTVLEDKQIYAIGHLVAHAVEGLDINDVVIVDSNGKLLSKNTTDPLAAATASQLDFQQKIESDMEKRIESILGRVVGEGHVVAKVSADLDFSQVSETQTIVDGDSSTPVSVEKNIDTMNGTRPGPIGAVGSQSNTPGQPPAVNGQITNDTNKNHEVTNYEVPKTVRRTTRPMGTQRRLSVAVVVDGRQVKSEDKDGKVLSKVEPWPPEKLKEFEDIVASATGIDKKRGDILEIKNIEFTREDFDEIQKALAEKDRKAYVQNMVIYGVIGLTILLFFLFVVRPFIKWITDNTIDSVDTFLPQTIEELEKLQKNSALPGLEESVPVLPEKVDPEKVEGEMLKEKIVTLIDQNPHKAALILKDWLHTEKPKPSEKEVGGKPKSASA
jgi:flagellar M-ring protein FliF